MAKDFDRAPALFVKGFDGTADAVKVRLFGYDGSDYTPVKVDADGTLYITDCYDVIDNGVVTIGSGDTETIVASNSDRVGGVFIGNGGPHRVYVSVGDTTHGADGAPMNANNRWHFKTRGKISVYNTGPNPCKVFYAEYGIS